MVGKSFRSSYKGNRNGTVSWRQRYKKDEALNVSNSSRSEVSRRLKQAKLMFKISLEPQERKCEGTVRMQSPSIRLRVLKTVKNIGLLCLNQFHGCPSPPRVFVGHFQLYLFPGSGICFLLVSPGVGNLFSGKKSNICRLFRHLAVF